MSSIYTYLNKNLYVIKDVVVESDGTTTVTATGATTTTDTTGSAEISTSTVTEVPVENLVSGEVDGNLSFTGGFIESKGFIAGTRGWRLSADGTLVGTGVTVSGAIVASSGVIGGFTITATAMYGGIIKTAATVGAGSTGVIMDTAGLRGYDSVLGLTFNLPTDGSAPTFASGVINYTTFNVNTNAVIRTSATVGDGSASSAGILINNTGLYGCQASQTLANANIKVLVDGTVTITGAINATSGKFGTATNYWSVGATGLTATSASADVIINYGKTDFNNTQTGFILGYDYSASAGKFYVGNTTDYLNWNGSALVIKGEITATSGVIGGTTISSTTLTGGIIQTSDTGDRLVMTEDSFISNNNPAIDCYEGNTCVSSLRPQIGTAGKGLRIESYEWTGATEATFITTGYGDDIGDLGGKYYWVEMGVLGNVGFAIYKDESLSNIMYATFAGTRIDGNIHPPTGTGTANGDIGRSDSTWDNMWVEDINYQTLSDFSDERLKKNVSDLDLGLNEILQLRPINFTWKKNDKNDVGFIAQEVKEIIPSMVKEAKQKEIETRMEKINPEDIPF